MADGNRNTAIIVLVVVVVAAGALGIVCCGGVLVFYFMGSSYDEARHTNELAQAREEAGELQRSAIRPMSLEIGTDGNTPLADRVDVVKKSAGMMWVDAGRLYFWIRRQDLEERAFENVWMILQCY